MTPDIAKIVAWLLELDSHEIYEHAPLAAEFKDLTGEEPCWPTHTTSQTLANIKNAKAGGTLDAPDVERLNAYGYEIAAALARKYAGYLSPCGGRGFLFRDCARALSAKVTEQQKNAS